MNHAKKSQNNTWKIVAIVLAVALVAVSCAWAFTAFNKPQTLPSGDSAATEAAVATPDETVAEKAVANPLSLWTDSAPLKAQLTEYIKAVTTEGSADFIPVDRRIAVFDMDGTLCCETDPGYFDHKLLYHRVTEDPDYIDKASDEEKETAEIIKEYFDTRSYPEGLDVKHGTAVATAFKGMTPEEFDAYVKKYRDQPAEGYNNMTMGQAFYKPMLQVVDYLQANDFTVYIVSGTDRLITRGLAEGTVNIPVSQMIGSDESFVASGQGDEDGLKYTFSKDDKVITGGDFTIEDVIAQVTSDDGTVHDLKLMQKLGIDTTDWNRVNAFCQDGRIAGKQFRDITSEELEQLAKKLRSIERKGGIRELEEPGPKAIVVPFK